jgi:hypothetical protein
MLHSLRASGRGANTNTFQLIACCGAIESACGCMGANN